ncbi:MAG TPA: G1 family glutamic endopeptidase, partial [Acetobacteraceae bacterium]|nr:G1 family glutamic endopeptidase [Acetobacteraceae bacterium]
MTAQPPPREQQPDYEEITFIPTPADFDPLNPNVGADELKRYGFPERPEPTNVELYALFASVFRQPLEFFNPIIELQETEQLELQPAHYLPFQETRITTSLNWSGAYIEAHSNLVLVQIAGTLTIPTISLPNNPVIGTKYRLSTWVGLDGQRLYLNASLPQVGVEQ